MISSGTTQADTIATQPRDLTYAVMRSLANSRIDRPEEVSDERIHEVIKFAQDLPVVFPGEYDLIELVRILRGLI